MANVGKLVYEISADTKRLEADVLRAQSTVDRAMSGIGRAATLAKTALAGVAVGAVFAKVVSEVQRLVGELDALDDVAQKTGAAVGELSKLQQIARINGTAFTDVEGALVKFVKTINTVGEETGDATRALKAIGLNIDELKGKDAAVNFQTVARALTQYEDSASKTAIALALFGKSGAQMLPMLKDTAEFGDIAAKVTAEQAAAAAKLHDELRRLQLQSDQTKQAFLVGMIPAINDVIERFNAGAKAAGSFRAALAIAFNAGEEDPGKKLRSVDETLTRLRESQARYETNKPEGFLSGRIAKDVYETNKLRIASLEADRAVLQVQQRQRALADAAGDTPGEKARFPRTRALDFQLGEKKPGGGAAKESPFEQELKRLTEAVAKAEELSEVERILADTARNRFGIITEGQKNQLLAAAAIVDLAKEDSKVRKEAEDAVKKQAEESARAQIAESNRLNQLRDQIKDLADPNNKLLRDWEDYNKLLERGLVTIREINAVAGDQRLAKLLNPDPTDFEVLNKALKEGDISLEKYRETLARIREEAKDTDEAGKDLFAALSSGSEQALIGGKRVRDVLSGIGQDIAKIILRLTVTQPIGNIFSSAVKGFDFGGFFSGLFRAEGGPISAGSPYIVGERGPELIVPNTSGTVIPNDALAGMGGGGISIVQHMTFGSDVDRTTLTAWAKEVQKNTIAAVASRVQRGGAYASAFR